MTREMGDLVGVMIPALWVLGLVGMAVWAYRRPRDGD